MGISPESHRVLCIFKQGSVTVRFGQQFVEDLYYVLAETFRKHLVRRQKDIRDKINGSQTLIRYYYSSFFCFHFPL